MKIPDVLPELLFLIPRLKGEVFSAFDDYWFKAEDLSEVLKASVERENGLDLIRVGFKVYEILEWSGEMSAHKVRPFSCTLSYHELMKLSGQTKYGP